VQGRLGQARGQLARRPSGSGPGDAGGLGGPEAGLNRLTATALTIGPAATLHANLAATPSDGFASSNGLSLRTGIPVIAPTADIAPEKIERVLFNLITNALRHTPSDGSVAVNVGRLDGELLVSVEDTGTGIEPDALGRMFERFWRADRARSEAGMGLGLAIARGLVEAHGGRIWAENREQGGARVSFTLPAPAET
jgi:signal transduction histidine kinase